MYDSYYPYVKQLINHIRSLSKAEIVLHQTWAYEKDSQHSGFFNYSKDQDLMAKAIEYATTKVAKQENLRIIECGKMFADIRKNSFFDINQGGKSINRDGFHLNLDFGRTAAASLWIKFFTGKMPKFFEENNLQEEYRYIYKVLKNM